MCLDPIGRLLRGYGRKGHKGMDDESGKCGR
jgi:hypothetical protein